jgi:hypothetical protein
MLTPLAKALLSRSCPLSLSSLGPATTPASAALSKPLLCHRCLHFGRRSSTTLSLTSCSLVGICFLCGYLSTTATLGWAWLSPQFNCTFFLPRCLFLVTPFLSPLIRPCGPLLLVLVAGSFGYVMYVCLVPICRWWWFEFLLVDLVYLW